MAEGFLWGSYPQSRRLTVGRILPRAAFERNALRVQSAIADLNTRLGH
jgi:hypothetical protein